MRRERLYLGDMIDAADAIAGFLRGVEKARFLSDDLLRSAVLQKLIVIGEAAAHIDTRFRAERPDVPWANAIGLRNIGVHAYFAVNWKTVWSTATKAVPALRTQIAKVLEEEPE